MIVCLDWMYIDMIVFHFHVKHVEKGPAILQHDAWKEIKMDKPSYGT